MEDQVDHQVKSLRQMLPIFSIRLNNGRFTIINIIDCYEGLGLTPSGGVDGHANHYEPVMMEPPGVHFDSNYSVLSTMDTQSSGMLQQPNYDAHVCTQSITFFLALPLPLPFS